MVCQLNPLPLGCGRAFIRYIVLREIFIFALMSLLLGRKKIMNTLAYQIALKLEKS